MGASPTPSKTAFASGMRSLRTMVKIDSPIIIILDTILFLRILEIASSKRGEIIPRQSANFCDNLRNVPISGFLARRATSPLPHLLIRIRRPELDRTPLVEIGPNAPDTTLREDEGVSLVISANPGAPGFVRRSSPPKKADVTVPNPVLFFTSASCAICAASTWVKSDPRASLSARDRLRAPAPLVPYPHLIGRGLS